MISTQQLPKSADELIQNLSLNPHPFGCGYFIETDREPIKTEIEKSNGEKVERNLSTCIIALFKGNQINPLHRTNSTQIIHYYPGGNSNLLVHLIEKNGRLKTYRMPDETFQLKIQPRTWFAFEVENKSENDFVVSGHTVAPGFDLNDFEPGNRHALTFEFPHLANFIERFTLNSSTPSCSNAESSVELADSKEQRLNICKR